MRTSVCCPLERQRSGGFSILELLIVLALMSFMVGLVVPRLGRTVDAIAGSGDRAEVQRQLEDLPLRAREEGRAITIPARESLKSVVDLPEGWSAVALTEVRVLDNGMCVQATVQVENEDAGEEWQLAAPDCRVSHAAR
jgi:hypothetical protein